MGRAELVPIWRRWLAQACNSQKGEANGSLVCVSSLFHAALALPFFSVSSFQLCETLLRAITTGLSGEGRAGSGCVFGSSGTVQNRSRTTPSFPGSTGSFSHRALIGRFVSDGSVAITLLVTSRSGVELLGK